ncbi:MAG TPA: hypothetical protein VM070_07635 [Candidatus Saccharimonadales bacterium]|nr:hypothetical protein [Candidatus Saccharimonadales bacterium]
MSDVNAETSSDDAKDARGTNKRAPGRPWSDGEVRQVLVAPADRELLQRLAKRLKRSMDAIDVVRRIGATPYEEQSPKQRDGKFWKQVTQVASTLEDLPPARPAAQSHAAAPAELPPPPVVTEPAFTAAPEPAPMSANEAAPFEEDLVIASSPALGVLEMLAMEDAVSGPVAIAAVQIAPRVMEVPTETRAADETTLVPTGELPLMLESSEPAIHVAESDLPDFDPDTLVPLAPTRPAAAVLDPMADLDIGDDFNISPLDPGTMEMADDPAEIRLLAQLREAAGEADAFDYAPTGVGDEGDTKVREELAARMAEEIPSVAGMTLVGLPEGGDIAVVDLEALGVGMDSGNVGLDTNPDMPQIVMTKLRAPVPRAITAAPRALMAEGSGPAKAAVTRHETPAAKRAAAKASEPAPVAAAPLAKEPVADFAKIALKYGELPMLEVDLGILRSGAPWVVARARRDASGVVSVRRAGPVRLSNDQMNDLARRFKAPVWSRGMNSVKVELEPGHPDHFMASANDLPHDVMPIGTPRKVTLS